MIIVVLGWGSLCWDPRVLRIRGDWRTDGPDLPIEFARVSGDGRLTLVLRKRAKRVRVLWAEMNTTTLNKAIGNLKEREGTNRESIGWVDLHNPSNNNCNVVRTAQIGIKRWARRKHFDAVVWTDLQRNFLEKTGRKLDGDNVIAYLKHLAGERRNKAEEYIRRAPRQIRTRMRCIIEDRLGWTYTVR